MIETAANRAPGRRSLHFMTRRDPFFRSGGGRSYGGGGTWVNVIDVILLALAAAVYPTLLAGVIVILGRPNPLRLLIAFLIGGMAISIVAGSAIVKALESSGAVSESHSSTKPAVDILVGIGSRLIAGNLERPHQARLSRRRAPDASANREEQPLLHEPGPRPRLGDDGVVAGLVLNLPGIW